MNPSPLRPLQVFGDVLDLLLPRRCSGCDRGLHPGEAALCLHCMEDLPLTRFHHDPLNPVELLLAGRLQLEAATALLRFDGAGRVQRLLHRMKYRGDRQVGIELGRLLGTE
ncbi:MAG: ComF family protein, partial [Flavobacteriales bacterium]|nr:ComF family protein [Flavobacteriales bacterium]